MLLFRKPPPDASNQWHEPRGLAWRVWCNGGQVPQPGCDCLLILTRLPSSETNPRLQILLDTPPFLWFLYAFWTLTVFYLNASSNSCIYTVLSPTLGPHFYHRERKQRLRKLKVTSQSLAVAGNLARARTQVPSPKLASETHCMTVVT